MCQCSGCENYETNDELSEREAQFLDYEFEEGGDEDDYDEENIDYLVQCKLITLWCTSFFHELVYANIYVQIQSLCSFHLVVSCCRHDKW